MAVAFNAPPHRRLFLSHQNCTTVPSRSPSNTDAPHLTGVPEGSSQEATEQPEGEDSGAPTAVGTTPSPASKLTREKGYTTCFSCCKEYRDDNLQAKHFCLYIILGLVVPPNALSISGVAAVCQCTSHASTSTARQLMRAEKVQECAVYIQRTKSVVIGALFLLPPALIPDVRHFPRERQLCTGSCAKLPVAQFNQATVPKVRGLLPLFDRVVVLAKGSRCDRRRDRIQGGYASHEAPNDFVFCIFEFGTCTCVPRWKHHEGFVKCRAGDIVHSFLGRSRWRREAAWRQTNLEMGRAHVWSNSVLASTLYQ